MSSQTSTILHHYITAFGLTFSNEIGDRTFIICALLAAQKDRSVVLVSLISIIAILSVNFLAIAVVYAAECLGFTQLKHYEKYMQFLTGFLSLAYGLFKVGIYLWNQRKVQSQLLPKINTENERRSTVQFRPNNEDNNNNYPSITQKRLTVSLINSCSSMVSASRNSLNDKINDLVPPKVQDKLKRKKSLITQDTDEIENIISSLRGESITDVIKVVFPMIVLSELGDKSMLTTILLASTFSLPAVCLGVMSGIMVCIPMAACLGYASSKYLNVIDFELIASIVMILIGCVLLLSPVVKLLY